MGLKSYDDIIESGAKFSCSGIGSFSQRRDGTGSIMASLQMIQKMLYGLKISLMSQELMVMNYRK